jgi:hypothetical protein
MGCDLAHNGNVQAGLQVSAERIVLGVDESKIAPLLASEEKIQSPNYFHSP